MSPRHRLLPALALAVAFASPAMADSRTVHGGALVATLNLDNSATIETDTSLHGEIRLTADDLSCVQVTDGASIGTSGCGDSLGHLRIEVPPGTPVTLNQEGDGDIQIGNIDAPLVVTIGGSGDVTAGHVGPLVLNVHGSGDTVIDTVRSAAVISSDSSGTVRLRHVEAPLRSQQNGSGDLVVGTIDSPAVELSMNSSGDAVLGKGTIGNLNARVFGSGDLVVAATAGNADLQASGGGDIKVGHVTGMLHKSAHGGSSIIVTDSDLASYGLGKMAQSAADDGDDITTSSGTHIHIHRSSSSGNGFHHFLAGIALLVILFAIWRTVQRGGGLGGLQNRFRGNSPPPAPSHPGVIAVRDTISRLEGRLARVEGYVTTREFDLQRKFRELDTKS